MTGAPLTKSAVLRGAYGDSAKSGVLKRADFLFVRSAYLLTNVHTHCN